MPHVLHYCQRYNLGKWFIGKYRLRKDFISCESPLLMSPPSDLAAKYNYGIRPGDNSRKDYSERQTKSHAFMICALIEALNDAAYYFKRHNCNNTITNYKRDYVFFDDMSTPEDEM